MVVGAAALAAPDAVLAAAVVATAVVATASALLTVVVVMVAASAAEVVVVAAAAVVAGVRAVVVMDGPVVPVVEGVVNNNNVSKLVHLQTPITPPQLHLTLQKAEPGTWVVQRAWRGEYKQLADWVVSAYSGSPPCSNWSRSVSVHSSPTLQTNWASKKRKVHHHQVGHTSGGTAAQPRQARV